MNQTDTTDGLVKFQQREVSSAGGEAASSREEARKGRCGWPRPGAEAGASPEAADPAAGEVGRESVKHEGKKERVLMTRKFTEKRKNKKVNRFGKKEN